MPALDHDPEFPGTTKKYSLYKFKWSKYESNPY